MSNNYRKYVKDRANEPTDFNPDDVKNVDISAESKDCNAVTVRRALDDKVVEEYINRQQDLCSTGTSFGDICASMIELHDKKNADYGDAFTKSMDIFGTTYLLSRLHDKLMRLISINDRGAIRVTSETMLDTLMDLACYAVMGIEYYQNQ